MSRTGRILGGVLAGYINQAVLTIAGLWVTSFLLVRLGTRDYGLWLVATQILSYLLLLDLGVVALLPRETALATGRAGGTHAAHDLPGLIARTTAVVLRQLPLVALASLAVWMALPERWAPLRPALGFVLIAFVLTFPLRLPQAVLYGLQDLAFSGTVLTAAWVIGTGTTLWLVWVGAGLEALAAGWVVTQIVSGTCMWFRLRSKFPSLVPSSVPRLDRGQMRQQLTAGLWVSLSQVAQALLGATDVVILGAMVGPEPVVSYFCTSKALSVLAHQPRILLQTAQPALSELRGIAARDRLSAACMSLTQATLLLSGAIACAVLAANQAFVSWWVGADRYGGDTLTVALVVLMMLRHWNAAAVFSIFSFGFEKRISLTSALDGTLTVVCSIALVPHLGSLGVVVGSLVGVACASLPLNLSTLARETGVSLSDLVRAAWPLAWRVALTGLVAGASTSIPEWNGILSVALTTTAVVGLYFALSFRVAVRPLFSSYFRTWVKRIRSAGGALPMPIAQR